MKFLTAIVLIFVYESAAASGRRLNESDESGRRSLASNIQPVRAVNLGGWLVIEKWMKTSLFENILNGDLLDGAKIHLKSSLLGTYVAAEGGGGGNLVANRKTPSGWETFKVWRVSDTSFQLRVSNNNFVTAENGGGGAVLATRTTPSTWETFKFERKGDLVHLKALNGQLLQAKNEKSVTADYTGASSWERNNPAVFVIEFDGNSFEPGDYQLANALGPRAAEVFQTHRDTFIKESDFEFLSQNKINAVRIPVGWWIAFDPTPAPFVPGSLQALDKAFEWGSKHNVKIIVDLHAAPGSQNPWGHSGTRDGVPEWTRPENIKKTLDVIDFLANRYKDRTALLGVELLNEPTANDVPKEILIKFYRDGYNVVRKHSSSAYVVFCQRIGDTDPSELVNIMQPSDYNVVLDIHLYSVFSPEFDGKSAKWNIEYVKTIHDRLIQRLNNASGASIFIGEWTNEWKVKGASNDDYKAFGNAQLEVYGKASFGWAYWSFVIMNNERLHWDFKQSVKDGHLKAPF